MNAGGSCRAGRELLRVVRQAFPAVAGGTKKRRLERPGLLDLQPGSRYTFRPGASAPGKVSMTGTLVNVGTVIAGGCLGSFLGDRLPQRLRDTVMQGIGLTVLVMGMTMALKTANILIVLGSILLGGFWASGGSSRRASTRLGNGCGPGRRRTPSSRGAMSAGDSSPPRSSSASDPWRSSDR